MKERPLWVGSCRTLNGRDPPGTAIRPRAPQLTFEPLHSKRDHGMLNLSVKQTDLKVAVFRPQARSHLLPTLGDHRAPSANLRSTEFLSMPMSEVPPENRPYYKVDPNLDRYIPNHIPAGERAWNLFLSLLIMAWGSYGIWADDLIVPTKRGGIHLHGTAALIMFGAIAAAALNFFSVVLDHLDTRNNELSYRRIAFGTQLLGWILFGIAIIVHILK